MPFPELARLNLTPAEARRWQGQLSPLVIRQDRFGKLRTVAGADIALREKTGYAAFIETSMYRSA